MGSERSKGQNSSHDISMDNSKTMGGAEGITTNLTLDALKTVIGVL